MKKLTLHFIVTILCLSFFGVVFAEDLTINSDTIWNPGTYNYDNVFITNDATLTFNGAVTLNAQNLTIDSGSYISADGKGYPAGQGSGAGTASVYGGSGGGYGGKGGKGGCAQGSGLTYGSAIAPVDLGSGGGGPGYTYKSVYYPSSGGSGGGAIRLNISDTLTLNGSILANGGNGGYPWGGGQGGGGSGGSIYIITNTLNGSGTIIAQGGNSGPDPGSCGGGGGGGGRIAIYFQNSNFTGKAEAKGGIGRGKNGEDGTVGLFDTLNNILYSGDSFRLQENDSPFNFNKVVLNNARMTTQENISLTANDLEIKDNSYLELSGNETLNLNNITLANNSILTSIPQAKIDLTIYNLNIDSTSSISVDAKGYSGGQGLGAGLRSGNGGSGGGYGGQGGEGGFPKKAGGSVYGSAIAPVDLGSGGGGPAYTYNNVYYPSSGGAGGGAIKLNIFDTLTLNGSILADGGNGGYPWGGGEGGGGSGGSIYIITNIFNGAGSITANGGNSGSTLGWAVGGGGGGGRIAIYCSTSNFTGDVETKGGIGLSKNGEDGTVVYQIPSLDAQVTAFTLSEKSSTTSTLFETLSAQGITLNNVLVNGDLNGNINFTNLELIKIDTGSFAGKGFSKGEFEANLEGITYKGNWKGLTYFIPSENKIYLKGEISGDISGICEGFITESTPESGVYDKFQAFWKINHLKTEIVSATINLEGILSYQPAYTFNSTLYLYQANLEGSAFGFYTGPLNAVVTHLSITGENEYKGDGLSIISYNSTLGQGQAYSYNKQNSPDIVDFFGLFETPILGILSATLDENKFPKVLSGTIERLDLGAISQPDLKVKVWGPQRVSPGQKINYIIEYRNDGMKGASNVFISCVLDTFVKYISASQGVYYSPYAHRLTWKIGDFPAKSMGYLSFQVEVIWGLPEGIPLEQNAYITNIGE